MQQKTLYSKNHMTRKFCKLISIRTQPLSNIYTYIHVQGVPVNKTPNSVSSLLPQLCWLVGVEFNAPLDTT